MSNSTPAYAHRARILQSQKVDLDALKVALKHRQIEPLGGGCTNSSTRRSIPFRAIPFVWTISRC